MNSVLKEEAVDTVVVEQKSLAEILVVSDEIPTDFYKNTAKYQAEIDVAIEHAKSLVHPLSDEGRKLAKADAALIRKFAKNRNAWSLEVFRSLTEKVKFWRDDITGKTKVLEQEADKILTRFEEHEAKQLSEIRKMLISFLNKTRSESSSLRDEFITDSSEFIEKLKKLSALTPNGSITGATKALLKGFVEAELAKQSMHDNRILTIENRCLRADINPPLGKVHFGDAAFWADEQVFEAKLEELVTAEIARRVEMEMRIEAALKKKEQAKIDAALAQERALVEQETRLKAAQEKKPEPELQAQAQAQEKPKPEIKAPTEEEIKQAEAKQKEEEILNANGKKVVRITATFEVSVRESISIEAVENHFKSKLPDDLTAILILCVGE